MMNFGSYTQDYVKIAKSIPLSTGNISRKKMAFTLAETLITLTIIGIVAAMTVPTLMSKYQKHTYVVGLKKAYSSLQNAMKMLPISMDCSSGDLDCTGWNIEDNAGEGEVVSDINEKRIKLLSSQFKTDKICGRSNIDDCIKHYLPDETATAVGGAFVTDDGMIFHSTYGVGADGWFELMVDVNGNKGPNKAGRDIFAFEVANKWKNDVPAGTVIPKGSSLLSKYYMGSYEGNASMGYWRNDCPNSLPSYYLNAFSCTGRVLEEDAMNY